MLERVYGALGEMWEGVPRLGLLHSLGMLADGLSDGEMCGDGGVQFLQFFHLEVCFGLGYVCSYPDCIERCPQAQRCVLCLWSCSGNILSGFRCCDTRLSGATCADSDDLSGEHAVCWRRQY